MSAVLQADIEALQELAKTLAATAETINGITVPAAVTMPGSPVATVSGQGTRAALDAYHRIGDNVSGMSATCESNAATYDDVERAFRTQLQRYTNGPA